MTLNFLFVQETKIHVFWNLRKPSFLVQSLPAKRKLGFLKNVLKKSDIFVRSATFLKGSDEAFEQIKKTCSQDPWQIHDFWEPNFLSAHFFFLWEHLVFFGDRHPGHAFSRFAKGSPIWKTRCSQKKIGCSQKKKRVLTRGRTDFRDCSQSEKFSLRPDELARILTSAGSTAQLSGFL